MANEHEKAYKAAGWRKGRSDERASWVSPSGLVRLYSARYGEPGIQIGHGRFKRTYGPKFDVNHALRAERLMKAWGITETISERAYLLRQRKEKLAELAEIDAELAKLAN